MRLTDVGATNYVLSCYHAGPTRLVMNKRTESKDFNATESGVPSQELCVLVSSMSSSRFLRCAKWGVLIFVALV